MDPEFLDYFLSQGKLPHFAKLIREGAYAPCHTFKPTKSVVLVDLRSHRKAHGEARDRGLAASLEGRPEILASGQSRRTEALWNIASRNGKNSAIVNWWATWPAEAVQGTIVSNHFPRSLHEPLEEATFPPDLAEELSSLRSPRSGGRGKGAGGSGNSRLLPRGRGERLPSEQPVPLAFSDRRGHLQRRCDRRAEPLPPDRVPRPSLAHRGSLPHHRRLYPFPLAFHRSAGRRAGIPDAFGRTESR